jgi:2-methylcitrate dehydratase PrpD
MMELTDKIARYVVELEYERLPPKVLEVAKTAFIDCIGVTLAGSTEKSAIICGQIARAEQAAGESSVFGQGFKSSAL